MDAVQPVKTPMKKSLQENLAFASYNLGATPLYTMFKITIPLIKPALLSGGLFAFATSFDEEV